MTISYSDKENINISVLTISLVLNLFLNSSVTKNSYYVVIIFDFWNGIIKQGLVILKLTRQIEKAAC